VTVREAPAAGEHAPSAAISTFIASDGAALAYRFDGPVDAPVLMLSNSLGTAMEMWAPQVGPLARAFRILRYDSRGHGRSAAPMGPYSIERLGLDALELIGGLKVGPVHFCGLSMGGMVGQWLAIHAPEALNRLVLSNTAASLGPASAWQARIDAIERHGIEAVSSVVRDRWFSAQAAPTVIAFGTAMVLATDPQGYAACCAAIRDMDQRAGLARIRKPTLVIAGAADVATPPERAAELVNAIAGARLQTLDAGHLSNLEQPIAFNEVVTRFFTEAAVDE
jgi:3-oxoadipate enol-lactonase